MPTPRFISYGRSPDEIEDDLRLYIALTYFNGRQAQDAALKRAEGMTRDSLWNLERLLSGKQVQEAGITRSFTRLELGWTV